MELENIGYNTSLGKSDHAVCEFHDVVRQDLKRSERTALSKMKYNHGNYRAKQFLGEHTLRKGILSSEYRTLLWKLEKAGKERDIV